MTEGFINFKKFEQELKRHIQDEMVAAGEVFVKEAVAKYEHEVRRSLGRAVLTLIEKTYLVEQDATHLIIRVERERKT